MADDNKCYSTDEENFCYSSIEDAVRAVFDYSGAEEGDIREIFEGTTEMFRAGDFTPGNMEDMLVEQAYDAGGAYADSWLNDLSESKKEDLADRIKDAINSWADDYELHPGFYGVDNVREILVKLLDGGDFEIMDER